MLSLLYPIACSVDLLRGFRCLERSRCDRALPFAAFVRQTFSGAQPMSQSTRALMQIIAHELVHFMEEIQR